MVEDHRETDLQQRKADKLVAYSTTPVIYVHEDDNRTPAFVRGIAYARVGWIGNPSDGYYGKTISFTIQDFYASVMLSESDRLEIIPNKRDQVQFSSMEELVENVRRYGYYGGIRLLKATIKRFWEVTKEYGLVLPKRNFVLHYRSSIPEQVGLAGSSAIITACFRALMRFYEISLPKVILPNIILSVETQELGIPAGLQDRVVQVYQGIVYMDFNKEHMDRYGYGRYEQLDPNEYPLPPIYVAYSEKAAQGTEITHSDLRSRYLRGDPQVLEAIRIWANLADEMKEALRQRDWEKVAYLVNKNFDVRRRVMSLHQAQVEMIELARSVGVSAKFTGSGGAICGTYQSNEQLQRLKEIFRTRGIKVITPTIALPSKEYESKS